LTDEVEDVANALAEWINTQPIVKDANGDPTIAPVYAAHVLLCDYIAREKRLSALPPPEAARQPLEAQIADLHVLLGDLAGILRMQHLRATAEHPAVEALLARADAALKAAERA